MKWFSLLWIKKPALQPGGGKWVGCVTHIIKHMHTLSSTVIDFTFADKVITRPYPKYRIRTISTSRFHLFAVKRSA